MIKIEDPSIKAMWNKYREKIKKNDIIDRENFTAWYFCDNKSDADELASLITSGIKTATSSLYDIYGINEEETFPKVGELSIITNWEGVAHCIIETTHVDIIPFNKVKESFAYLEGEGDRSLEYWQRVHIDFFKRELEDYSRTFKEDMLVVCEKFKVVYK